MPAQPEGERVTLPHEVWNLRVCENCGQPTHLTDGCGMSSEHVGPFSIRKCALVELDE